MRVVKPMQHTEETGLIFDIQRDCTEDGPGIRTTVFLKGCSLRCPWCQNPEGIRSYPELIWYDKRCIGTKRCIDACPVDALTLTRAGMLVDRKLCDACGKCVEVCPGRALEVAGKLYSVGEVVEIALRDRVFYEKSGGGVTLSGGEVALQARFSVSLLRSLKEAGVHTAIETSLAANWEVLRPLVEATDLVILDLKLMDSEKHSTLLGIPLDLVLSNARNVALLKKPIWVHTPIIPKYTDSEENIERVARFIKSNLPAAERYELLAFNKTCAQKYRRLGLTWELESEDLTSVDRMELLAALAREQGVQFVTWSGLVKRASAAAPPTQAPPGPLG
jgi:pyruvate formate lyase activating enzyme